MRRHLKAKEERESSQHVTRQEPQKWGENEEKSRDLTEKESRDPSEYMKDPAEARNEEEAMKIPGSYWHQQSASAKEEQLAEAEPQTKPEEEAVISTKTEDLPTKTKTEEQTLIKDTVEAVERGEKDSAEDGRKDTEPTEESSTQQPLTEVISKTDDSVHGQEGKRQSEEGSNQQSVPGTQTVADECNEPGSGEEPDKARSVRWKCNLL